MANRRSPLAIRYSLFAVLLRARRELLLDRALDVARAHRELLVLGLEQEGVEAAAAVDRLQRIGGNAQLHRAAERVRHHGDVDQIGEEAPLGLDVRVADLVADLRALAGQFTTPGHGYETFRLSRPRALARLGCSIRVSWDGGRIETRPRGVKVAASPGAGRSPPSGPRGWPCIISRVPDHINDLFGAEWKGWRAARERPAARAPFEFRFLEFVRRVVWGRISGCVGAFQASASYRGGCLRACGIDRAGRCARPGRLDARYVVTLAGLPIGTGNWVID